MALALIRRLVALAIRETRTDSVKGKERLVEQFTDPEEEEVGGPGGGACISQGGDDVCGGGGACVSQGGLCLDLLNSPPYSPAHSHPPTHPTHPTPTPTHLPPPPRCMCGCRGPLQSAPPPPLPPHTHKLTHTLEGVRDPRTPYTHQCAPHSPALPALTQDDDLDALDPEP